MTVSGWSRSNPTLVAATLLLPACLFQAACGPGATTSPGAGPSVPGVSASPAHEPEPSPLAVSALPSLRTPSPLALTPGRGLPASLRDHEWMRLPTSHKVIALTFDAGSGAQGLPSILDSLARARVPASFFLTGRWIATYPAEARRIAAVTGYSIGNHTMNHPDLTGLSDGQVRQEIDDADRWMRDVTGRDAHPLFRFPYGARNPHTMSVVNGLNYGSIRWTVDTLGWEGTLGGQSAQSVFTRAVGAATPGEIVLMHVGASPDGSTLDADALPRVITELRRRGYSFVSLGDYV